LQHSIETSRRRAVAKSSLSKRLRLGLERSLAALDYSRGGGTIVITKLDRLTRSARHLSELVDQLEAEGVALRILNFGGGAVDARRATGRLMLNMFAAMAQFEREMMLERQREGKVGSPLPTRRRKMPSGFSEKARR
jgi:DNA invertase Pin-like site-specific DNA recombinase